jgi:hypothetical protein
VEDDATKAQQICELAEELRIVAVAFSDHRDREIILQYADEIEHLTTKSKHA